ncbi:hypothetical protein E2562_010702 [Oryza meyeriana var. granulata]|uniref:Pentacotripeptide-repeat region of PRORP domain-containing protein n=1 Tax=Oryza meyeriana var. granulata TaxID=110450 RepID=A0A6G1EW29_9ORYZ|nr:hypothetical protein E2562_010702 [Oryza meyeriana var. granulata]
MAAQYGEVAPPNVSSSSQHLSANYSSSRRRPPIPPPPSQSPRARHCRHQPPPRYGAKSSPATTPAPLARDAFTRAPERSVAMNPGARPPTLRTLPARLWPPTRRLCGVHAGSGVEGPGVGGSDGGDVRVGREKEEEEEEEEAGLDAGRVPQEVLLRLPPPDRAETNDNDGENVSVGGGPGSRRRFFEELRLEAERIVRILLQDGPGFNTRQALDEMRPRVSNALVREVLLKIAVSIDSVNRSRYPRLAYKFFLWAEQQEGYQHGTSMYNLILKIFAECGELRAMWRLLEEMTDKGLPVSSRTFHLLVCTFGQAGLRRRLVERFIKSSNFNYRPFRNSFNAILHTLLTIEQYSLIEWVHQKMIAEGHSPDVLTYNVVMRAKYMLGKLDQFHKLLDEMGKNGLAPDLYTYNLLLHVLDGLSRAGNLEACKYFFDEMIKKGCQPDVVCYTVMITGYVAAGEFDEAQKFFDDMLLRGQLPNVYTYNSMICGLCIVGKFDKACSLLKDMDLRGCTPNFTVYSTLVSRLRNAGKDSEANNVIQYMTNKGHYLHLLSRFRGYRRW